MTKTQRAELLQAIHEAMAAGGALAADGIVDRVIARKPLWQSLRDDLARERLLALVNAALSHAIAQDPQLALPGFELIPRRLQQVRPGHGRTRAPAILTAHATLAQLVAYRDLYRRRLGAADKRKESEGLHLKQLDTLVRLVSSYAKKDPEITVEEALRRKSAR